MTLITAKQIARNSDDYKDQYDEMLDDLYGEIHIGSHVFYPSDMLKECDLTAYYCGLCEYIDELDSENPLYECPICKAEYDDQDIATHCCQRIADTLTDDLTDAICERIAFMIINE